MKQEKIKVTLLVLCMLFCGAVYSKWYGSGVLEMKEEVSQNINQPEAEYTTNLININHAQKEELMLLDGVGEKTAERIIAYRQQQGMFENIADIQNVKGVGEKTFAEIAPYITVN